MKEKCLAALGIAVGFESFNSFFFTLYKTGTNQSAILGQVQGFKRTFTFGVPGWKVGFPNQVSAFQIKLCEKTLQPVLGIGGKSCDKYRFLSRRNGVASVFGVITPEDIRPLIRNFLLRVQPM